MFQNIFYFAGYGLMILGSLFVLTSLTGDLEQKSPWLTDRKWKRVVWLLSCLVGIPLIITTVKFPSLLLNELKEFLSKKSRNRR